MCGIVGYFSDNFDNKLDISILKCMCTNIYHRGPDDEGYFCDFNVGLGMRRLSIIDLQSGKQPIHSQDGTKIIVFNGEIYNYRELRSTLMQYGAVFSTQSDTEVILHQFEREGTTCVHKLNGMFSFAIWDSQKKSLFLARDRMGVKPLYYYWDGKTFLFASEIKALIASNLVPRTLNPKALWDYLTFRYVPQPETIWQNIYKLPPAHTLTISFDKPAPQIKRYWDIPYTDEINIKPIDEYISEFEALFLDAVRLRLIADVPVGVLLSGGIDSSAVAAAIAELHNRGLNSFSVAFADSPQTNELPYARQVAQHVGTNHHEIIIGNKEFMDFLPRLVYYSDEPLADLAAIPLYYVSSLACQHVKVVLSGEGSDEILAGYNFDGSMHKWELIRQFQNLPYWFRHDFLIHLVQILHPSSSAFLEKINTPHALRLIRFPQNMTHYLTSQEKENLFLDDSSFPDSIEKISEELKHLDTKEPLHQALYTYCQSWLVEDLLMKADKMTMANSIELRVPFLDYRLVEWAAQTPPNIKVGISYNGKLETKWILRRFAEKRLPSAIIQRPKQGFPVPVYEWLSRSEKTWVFDILCSADTYLNRWLKPKALRNFSKKGTAQHASAVDKHQLWHLLILELWMKEWKPN